MSANQTANPVRATHLRQMRLVREIVPGVFHASGEAIYCVDLDAPFTANLVSGQKVHNPQGATGAGYSARHRQHIEIGGISIAPDYKQLKKWLDKIYTRVSKRTENGKDIYVYRKFPFESPNVQSDTIEIGQTDDADRATLAMLSEFSLQSGRTSEPAASTSMFARKPTRGVEMTGSVVQNAILLFNAVNVTTDGVFYIYLPGEDVKTLTLEIGDTEVEIEAKLLALGITAEVVGTVAVASGAKHRLTANNATGNATIYDTIEVVPGMSAGALEDLVQAKGNAFATAVVTGSTTAITKVNKVTDGTGTVYSGGSVTDAANAFDADSGTVATLQAGGQIGWNFATPIVIDVLRITRDADPPIGADVHGTFQGSMNGTFSDAVTLKTFTDGDLMTSGTIEAIANTTAYKAYRFVNNEGAQITIKTMELLADNPSTGFYEIEFDEEYGAQEITSTPGAGWSTSNTEPGNAGGSITASVSEPENVSINVVKQSGNGWSGTQSQIGSSGSPVILDESPLTAADWTIRNSATFGGLANSNNTLSAAYNHNWQISEIASPHYTANGSETFDRFKMGKRLSTLEISLEDSTDGDYADIEAGVYDTLNRVSKAQWWELGYRSGDNIHALLVRMYMAVTDDPGQEDEDDVEGRSVTLTEIALGTGEEFCTDIELHLPQGTFAD